MSKLIDLIGERFGRLVVIRQVGKDKWGKFKWLCKCDCGNKVIVLGNNLRRGSTKSCGCLQKEIAIKIKTNAIKHGHGRKWKRTRTYKSWSHMIQRCTNTNHKYYYLYGGRGIIVCKRWLKFENFLEDMGEKPEGLSLDRKNNNKNYCKSNCRWATPKQQARNRRDSLYVPYNEENRLFVELCEEHNMPRKIVYNRFYNYGWTLREALTTPIRKNRCITR